jgi:hypothetical protein
VESIHLATFRSNKIKLVISWPGFDSSRCTVNSGSLTSLQSGNWGVLSPRREEIGVQSQLLAIWMIKCVLGP